MVADRDIQFTMFVVASRIASSSEERSPIAITCVGDSKRGAAIATHLAITLGRVGIAQVQEAPGDVDWQVHRCAFHQLIEVQVAAPRPEAPGVASRPRGVAQGEPHHQWLAQNGVWRRFVVKEDTVEFHGDDPSRTM